MRLIDAEKLMDALNVFTDREHADPKWMACLESVKEIITFLPTVDAVPVIRCKDCQFYEPWNEKEGVCGGLADGSYVTCDGYCYEASRKEK